MKSSDRALLRAVYLLVTAIGLIVIAYISSGGHGTNLSAILYWAGFILFAFGVVIGLFGFISGIIGRK